MTEKDPWADFQDACAEFQVALKFYAEQEQDQVFADANPERNHWVRPVGEIERHAELFFRGYKAGPGEALYYVCKRSPKGLGKLVIRGNPDDPCDLTEEQARKVWKLAAADNF